MVFHHLYRTDILSLNAIRCNAIFARKHIHILNVEMVDRYTLILHHATF